MWLFGMSSILLAYIVSLFSTSQLAAFAFIAGGQAIFALIYFLT
jgi:ATP-binding cassette subfamily A (ABC1) protein 3